MQSTANVFIRNFAQPVFVLSHTYLNDLSKEYSDGFNHNIDLRIAGVDLLRKREKATTPCNASLSDEDGIWRDRVIDEVGCVPQFWSRFVINSSLDYNITECTQKQYRKFDHVYHPLNNFENGSKLYTMPCTQMTSTVISDVQTTGRSWNNRQPSTISIAFLYAAELYKEIKNNEAYNSETLCSQIGGFVGT